MAEYYTDLRLPIKTFSDILQTGDHSLLYIEKPEKKEDQEDLYEVWFKIYNDYCKEDKVSNKHIKQMGKIEDLKRKYRDIKLLLKMVDCEFSEVRIKAKELLKAEGYLFRENQPFDEELDRLHKRLDSLHTRIQIEKNKLPKEQKKEGISIIKEAVRLEQILGGKQEIDVFTMQTIKYIHKKHLALEMAAERKKAMDKNQRKR